MKMTPIIYRTQTDSWSDLSAPKNGRLIDFFKDSTVHYNERGTECVQSTSNFALILDAETNSLVQVWLNDGEYEITFHTPQQVQRFL